MQLNFTRRILTGTQPIPIEQAPNDEPLRCRPFTRIAHTCSRADGKTCMILIEGGASAVNDLNYINPASTHFRRRVQRYRGCEPGRDDRAQQPRCADHRRYDFRDSER